MNHEDAQVYVDNDGNTYAVERASNGRFVAIRTNAGGHRKRVTAVADGKSVARVNDALTHYAEQRGLNRL